MIKGASTLLITDELPSWIMIQFRPFMDSECQEPTLIRIDKANTASPPQAERLFMHGATRAVSTLDENPNDTINL
ncbi:hypothetical protein ACH5RR_041215, partial [Cinchona calisaya]